MPGGTAHWVFTDATGNYNNATGDVAIAITKADATVTVTGYTGVFDGAAHGATGTATGVGGAALSGLDLGRSFTNVPGGTAHWAFTDATGNYNDAAGDVGDRHHQGRRHRHGHRLHRRVRRRGARRDRHGDGRRRRRR